MRAAFAAGKSAALLGIEGSELLDCDPSRVETAAGWGAKYVTLTWNHANALSGTNAEQTDAGLTDTGRAFVRELARCRVLPDVSHLSDRGFWDVVELGLGPVIASHSNSRAICAHPRNLTDDMFRAIIQSGGIAGLNFYQDFVGGTEYNFGALLRHADHFLELGGENALCFGGDLDGCEQLCAGMQGLQSIHTLYAAFSAHGYDDALLRKLFFENWLRLLECVE